MEEDAGDEREAANGVEGVQAIGAAHEVAPRPHVTTGLPDSTAVVVCSVSESTTACVPAGVLAIDRRQDAPSAPAAATLLLPAI